MYRELFPWLNGTFVVLFGAELVEMIRITRQTDYGILLLSLMASGPLDEVHTAKQAAEQAKIPLPMASKILKALAKGGLLVSHRGVKGGYSLAASAEHISLAAVIQALEGPIGITECSFNPGGCEQEGSCPVQSNWLRISLAMRDALDKIPLSDMVVPQIHRSDVPLIAGPSQAARPL
jgi:FeS assembly SUF system regulator